MFQISASAKAKKYGNFNILSKTDSNPQSASIKVEDVDRDRHTLGQYGFKRTSFSSKQQLVIIGVSLDHLSRSSQLFICCTGVFVFYLVYGYVQVSGHFLSYLLCVELCQNCKSMKTITFDILHRN